ncbi:MAG: tetratricopeptide repeat protein [bacterium]
MNMLYKRTFLAILTLSLFQTAVYGQNDDKSLSIFDVSVSDSIWDKYSLDDLVEFQKYYDNETEKLLKEADQSRLRGIQDLESFVKGHPNSPILDKIIIRLAHMHYQQAIQDFGIASETYSEQLELYEKGVFAQPPREPKKNYDRPLALYEQLFDEFPKSTLVDDAMYSKGFLLEELGRTEEAFEVFYQLIEDFPDSRYSPIAYMRMAEYYFNPPQHDLEKAIALYKKILKFKESSKYDAALYRLGWAYYKLSDYPSAISYFTVLADDIELAKSIDPKHKYHFPAVKDEAIEYIGISFLDFGGANRAAEYFTEIGGRSYGFEVLKKIGDSYMDVKEEYENAIETYQLILAMYPESPVAPQIQAKIAEGYRQLEDERMAYVRRSELFRKYKSDGAWWDKTDDPTAKNEANVLAERALRDNINLLLKSAKETNDPSLYFQAINDSRDYLNSFPKDSNAVFIHWNMALTLDTKLKMRDEAYDEYLKISNRYWNTKFQKQAAENAIAIADEVIRVDSLKTGQASRSDIVTNLAKPDSTKQSLSLRPEELDPAEKKLAEALDNYLILFPHDTESAEILAKAGALYYERHQFNNSLKYFKTLIKHFPDSPEANYARYITMESYFGKGDFESTEIIAKKLRDLSPEYANNANKRLSESIFLRAKAFADSLEHDKAAAEYHRMVTEVPSSEFADLALYNAAVEHERGQKFTKAIDSYSQLLGNYPDSEHYLNALNNMAFDYRELNDNINAALAYEKLADQHMKEQPAQVALYNASVSYVEAKEWAHAINVNNKFVDRFPQSEDADELLFSNAHYYLKLNDIESANRIYAEFASKFPDSPRVVEAYYYRGLYYKDNARLNAAKTEFDKAIRTNSHLQKNKKQTNDFYAAEALFQLAEIKFNEFKQIKFKLPRENLTANKKRKKALLLELVDNYTQTARYGTFRLHQATYQIGNCYEEFAETWAKQEISQQDESQRILAQKDVNDSAAELYERAVDSYKSGLNALVKFSESYRKSLDTDSVNVRESRLSAVDTTLASGERWIQKCRDKISESLFHVAELKLSSAKQLLASSPPAGIQKLEELVYRSQLLVKAIKPVLNEAVAAHTHNIEEGKALGLENEWIDFSKDKLVSASTLIAREFETLGREALQGYQVLVRPYQNLIKNQDETALEIADQMSNFLELSKSFSLASVKESNDKIKQFRSMDLQTTAVEQTKTNLTHFIYDFYGQVDSLSSQADKLRESYESLFNEMKAPDYEDAFLTFDDAYFTLNDLSSKLLESGYKVSRDLGIVNSGVRKITLALVRKQPEKFAKELGLAVVSRSIVTSSSWLATLNPLNGWHEIEYDDSSWIPALEEGAGSHISGPDIKTIWMAGDDSSHEAVNGSFQVAPSRPFRVYFRKSFQVEGLPVSGMLRLCVDDSYNLFFNGKYIAQHQSDASNGSAGTFVHDVSELLQAGKNTIAIEVLDSDRSQGLFEAVYEIKNIPNWRDTKDKNDASAMEANSKGSKELKFEN